MLKEILNIDPEEEEKVLESEESERIQTIDIKKLHTLYYIRNGVLHL